jgi:DNA polymerase III delta prime subunit
MNHIVYITNITQNTNYPRHDLRLNNPKKSDISKIHTELNTQSIHKRQRVILITNCSKNFQLHMRIIMEKNAKHVQFIIVTDNYHSVIPPIQSRCVVEYGQWTITDPMEIKLRELVMSEIQLTPAEISEYLL